MGLIRSVHRTYIKRIWVLYVAYMGRIGTYMGRKGKEAWVSHHWVSNVCHIKLAGSRAQTDVALAGNAQGCTGLRKLPLEHTTWYTRTPSISATAPAGVWWLTHTCSTVCSMFRWWTRSVTASWTRSCRHCCPSSRSVRSWRCGSRETGVGRYEPVPRCRRVKGRRSRRRSVTHRSRCVPSPEFTNATYMWVIWTVYGTYIERICRLYETYIAHISSVYVGYMERIWNVYRTYM